MKEVTSFEEITELMQKNFKAGMETNLFLSKEALQEGIFQHLLQYDVFEGGFLLYKKRPEDMLCYYQLTDFSAIETPKKMISNLHDMLVVEIVQKNHQEAKSVSFFQKLGFVETIKRVRMKKVFQPTEEVHDLLAEGVQEATLTQLDATLKLLRESFSIHTGCLPSESELASLITQKKILVVCPKPQEIAGVLHFDMTKAGFEIRHLAVKQEYQKQGIASMMMQKYHEKVFTKMGYVWVSTENLVAQKLYQKFGYEIEETNSIVMIRKDEEDGKTTKSFNGN